MTLEFKRLSEDNVWILQRVADDVFDDAVDLHKAKRFLMDRENFLIVAIENGIVIGQIKGFVHFQFDAPPDLFIDNLGVTPNKQRQGVARRLIALALEVGKPFGTEEAWVLTEQDNVVAQAVYANSGAEFRTTTMFSFALDSKSREGA